MYDLATTNKDIERLAIKHPGWKPERHTLSQIDAANAHFKTLWDPELEKWKRKLDAKEQAWIVNERRMAALDFRYWGSHYSWLLDWQERPSHFTPNVAQEIKLDLWAEAERAGHAICEMSLKARQLGVSTLCELVVAHRVQFYPYVNAVVSSSDPRKSELMARMLEFCLNKQPAFMVPIMTGYSKGEQIEYGRKGTVLTIQHGSQQTGIARGTTPTIAHLSEVADYQHPGDLIDASLLRAMHESKRMFLVLESTGKGRHNWWHNTWEFAKANWQGGRSRLRPQFLPWYVGTDIYPTPVWLAAHPIPVGYVPSDEAIKHSERAADYVRGNPVLSRYLGQDWRMPLRQQWFWEVTRDEYKAKKMLHVFYAEMTSDDMESFQSTAISVFDADLIGQYREAVQKPLGVFKLVGPPAEIHPRHWPTKAETVHDMPVIPIDDIYKLVPVKWTCGAGDDPLGKVLIWNFPEPGFDYGLGFDSSNGVGLDRSVIEILRCGTSKHCDLQVAEFASPLLNAAEMVPFCHALGKFYTPKMRGNNVKLQTKMVIEIQTGGNITQLELRKRGWRRFHRWLRGYDQRVLKANRSNTLGWSTNQWSRGQLITKLMEYLRQGSININSAWFVDEMADLEADEITQKIAAQSGAFDDRIMALGMVLFSLHDLEIKLGAPTVASKMLVTAQHTDWPVYDPGVQGRETKADPLDRFSPERETEPKWNADLVETR